MSRLTHRLFEATVVVLLLMLGCHAAMAASRMPQRRGRVIIIRGAFTVFSLGMNELGDKLAAYGLDVDVVADISAGRITDKLVSEYRRNRNMGPIIMIGHSRGAELGPKQARELQQHGIPVKLIVMVDAVHKTSIPGNVERCVNLYHNNSIGLVHGVPARAESRKTELLNTDIDRLRSRQRGGAINHFNIDSSPWIHDLVVAEVLKVCPAAGSASEATAAKTTTSRPSTAQRTTSQPTRRSTSPTTTRSTAPSSTAQRPTRTVAPQRSRSGLRYPSGVAAGLWAGSSAQRSSANSSKQSGSNAETSGTRRSYRSSRSNSSSPSGPSRSLKSAQSRTADPTPRTAKRSSSSAPSRSAQSAQKSSTRGKTSQPSTAGRGKQQSEKTTGSNKPQSGETEPAARDSGSTKESASAPKKISDSKSTKKRTSKPIQIKVDG